MNVHPSDPRELASLTPERRRLVERLSARIHDLRNVEICTQSALREAQTELERLTRRSCLTSLEAVDEDLRDAESLETCDQARVEVERLERELVFVRGAIAGHCEDLDELLVLRRGA